MSETSRRAVLAGAAGLSAATILAACGAGAEDNGATPAATAGSQPTGGAPSAAPTSGGGAAGALAKTADIPVGGGKIFPTEGVVVVQPAAGTFKGFSATCTHQQCAISSVADGMITCGCHGSQFSAADGSVKNGPATRALPAKDLKLEGGSISLA